MAQQVPGQPYYGQQVVFMPSGQGYAQVIQPGAPMQIGAPVKERLWDGTEWAAVIDANGVPRWNLAQNSFELRCCGRGELTQRIERARVDSKLDPTQRQLILRYLDVFDSSCRADRWCRLMIIYAPLFCLGLCIGACLASKWSAWEEDTRRLEQQYEAEAIKKWGR
jgi:hypothetical protein